MLRNYLKIALRNLRKNRVYSFINITGLAVGMAVALVIALWITDELSFDHYHQRHGTLAGVWDTQTWNGQTGTGAGIDIPVAAELRNNYANDFKTIALASRQGEKNIFSVGEKKIIAEGIYAEPQLADMLTLKMLEGDRLALRAPGSVLLSASLATTLFGSSSAINKPVRLNDKVEAMVGGVYEDLPANTTFHETNYILPWVDYLSMQGAEAATQWGNHGYRLYVEVNDPADFGKITARIKGIPGGHLNEGNEEILLHPMDSWHLRSEFKNGKVAGGKIQFVWLFGLIGGFVLLLACINFMNLGTARSEKRAKEVGIRKTIGSLRGQLMSQFLAESVLTALLALLIAIGITILVLPYFNQIAGKHIGMPWTSLFFWLGLLGFTLFTGLLAGSYPAFYLSAFQPVRVLKGTFKQGRLAALPRQILVVLQFTVSVALIICTMVVYRQIQFARTRTLGYSKESMITVPISNPEIASHYNALRSDLLATGAVEQMAQSSSPETSINAALTGFEWKGKDPGNSPLFGVIGVSHDFGTTVQWKVSAGRDLARNFPTDSSAFILNESAVKLTGLAHPVGESFRFNGVEHLIVGVVKDMVMESPFTATSPTIFLIDYHWANFFTVRMKAGLPVSEALDKISSVFKKYNPASPFDYTFVDDAFAQKFSNEKRIGNLATVFAILAIFISCLGLFGLAAYVTSQRRKEIGLRKILGASLWSIWSLLSREFVLLISLSLLIGSLLSGIIMHNWLQQYPYRATLSGWIFVAACGGALLITLITVSFQTIRAGRAKPVVSLRSE